MKASMKKLVVAVMMIAMPTFMAVVLLGVTASTASADEKKFSDWSQAVNLGPVVNSSDYDACPTISKDGLSLYFRSNRPGGEGGFDIWVSQRDSLEDPWQAPVNLGPVINGSANEYCTALSVDGYWMIFVSDRLGCGPQGTQDLWISHRKNKRDDFGWETPENLGCVVNSAVQENGPCLVEDEATGRTLLYFSSTRPGGLGGLDIYVSAAIDDGEDFFIFGLTMVTFIIFIVLFTAAFGRLFCGWVCPQTIFMEMLFKSWVYYYNQQVRPSNLQWFLNLYVWSTTYLVCGKR